MFIFPITKLWYTAGGLYYSRWPLHINAILRQDGRGWYPVFFQITLPHFAVKF